MQVKNSEPIIFYEPENDDCTVNYNDTCTHEKTIDDDGCTICITCGAQLDEQLVDNETCFYGNSDTRYSQDPSRHNNGYSDEKSLFPDLEALNIPINIINFANEEYKAIVKDKIYRAKNRLAIIFACTWKAYQHFNIYREPYELASLFKLTKKQISIGLKTYANIFRKNSNKIQLVPLNFVPMLLDKVHISPDRREICIHDITIINDFVKTKNKSFNSTSAKSIAAGLVYYYFKLTNVKITRSQFAIVAGLTDITFTKIAKDIHTILEIDKKIKF